MDILSLVRNDQNVIKLPIMEEKKELYNKTLTRSELICNETIISDENTELSKTIFIIDIDMNKKSKCKYKHIIEIKTVLLNNKKYYSLTDIIKIFKPDNIDAIINVERNGMCFKVTKILLKGPRNFKKHFKSKSKIKYNSSDLISYPKLYLEETELLDKFDLIFDRSIVIENGNVFINNKPDKSSKRINYILSGHLNAGRREDLERVNFSKFVPQVFKFGFGKKSTKTKPTKYFLKYNK